MAIELPQSLEDRLDRLEKIALDRIPEKGYLFADISSYVAFLDNLNRCDELLWRYLMSVGKMTKESYKEEESANKTRLDMFIYFRDNSNVKKVKDVLMQIAERKISPWIVERWIDAWVIENLDEIRAFEIGYPEYAAQLSEIRKYMEIDDMCDGNCEECDEFN